MMRLYIFHLTSHHFYAHSYFIYIEIKANSKVTWMNDIRNSYILSGNGTQCLLNKKSINITEEGSNVVSSFMKNNELYNEDMKGNPILDNLVMGNDSKVAVIMGITDNELAAVKEMTNLKAKLNKETLPYTLEDSAVRIIKFWNDFKHSTFHERECAKLNAPIKHVEWVAGLDSLVEKREKRAKKGKAKKIIGEDNHTRQIAKFGRNVDSDLFKHNPCPIRHCKHGVFGAIFTKYDEELQLQILRTSLGEKQKTPKTPNWNLDSWNFSDVDPKKNRLVQCKLRNLKISIGNHFSIYQGLEKDDETMKTDHTEYGVLPRKWREIVKKHVDSKNNICQIIDKKICKKRKRNITVEKQDIKDDKSSDTDTDHEYETATV